jgi:hypothetical protein
MHEFAFFFEKIEMRWIITVELLVQSKIDTQAPLVD